VRELITKLTVTDADAASALRVISHFDSLLEQRASISALIRAAAVLADTVAGYRDLSRERSIRVDSQGRGLPTALDRAIPPGSALWESHGTSIWLEREGSEGPLDGLVLERCGRSVRVVLQSADDASPTSRAIRAACDPSTRSDDRQVALRTLSLVGETVVAVQHADSADPHFPVGTVVAGNRVTIVNRAFPLALDPTVPSGLARADVADDIPSALSHAVQALRFASSRLEEPPHIWAEDLGSLVDLGARIDGATAAAMSDVRRIERLRSERPWVTGLLHAYLSHASLREVARTQHLHHSTLGQRITWLEGRLGYSLRDPAGFARATTGLQMWRLADFDVPADHEA
jgi:hypothetical protein